jgi:hypothetical protein
MFISARSADKRVQRVRLVADPLGAVPLSELVVGGKRVAGCCGGGHNHIHDQATSASRSGAAGMSVVVCPRCQRAQPAEARYCHRDGADLSATPEAAKGKLPTEFVFGSGRACTTYDEFAQACRDEWATARDLLREGVFKTYFTSTGRLDLAKAAQEAATAPDLDLALTTFLDRLPTTTPGEPPRLDIQPRRFLLGTLRRGESRIFRLVVANTGKGVLAGTMTISEGGDWLRLDPAAQTSRLVTAQTQRDFLALPLEVAVKTTSQQHFLLRVATQGLIVPASLHGRLTLITNGGIVEIPVQLNVAALPFADGPLGGAATPRGLAIKMQAQPKAAVPLLESGMVARWFELNGWGYPVVGPRAQGIAAVQQFFEAMGLAKPPLVQLTPDELVLQCPSPEPLRGQVVLQTPARKWVYAQVQSDADWLQPLQSSISGPQKATIDFTIETARLPVGREQTAHLIVWANGGQQLATRIRATAIRPREPLARRWLRPLAASALAACALRLFLAIPADLFARVLTAYLTPSPRPAAGSTSRWLWSLIADIDAQLTAPGSLVSWLASPLDHEAFVRHFVVATSWLGALVGVGLIARRSPRISDWPNGLVAGAGGGLVVAAVVACLLPFADWPARWGWQAVAAAFADSSIAASPWVWTAAWIAWVSTSWMLFGLILGLALPCLGNAGRAAVEALARPFAALFRAAGLE